MAIIGKKWSFSAAHQLPNHFGKCANLHGHNYTVEVALVGSIQHEAHSPSDEGMVFDYYYLSQAWKPIEGELDHQYLNDTLPELFEITTAENLACWIFGKVLEMLVTVSDEAGFNVQWVRVSETDGTFAEVDQDDWEAFLEWQGRMRDKMP